MPNRRRRRRNRRNHWESPPNESSIFQQSRLRWRQQWRPGPNTRRNSSNSTSNGRNRNLNENNTSSSLNDSNQHVEGNCDLPGFYYCSQQKRYFRILPSHNNFNCVTSDSLKAKEIQKKTEETKIKSISMIPLTYDLRLGNLNNKKYMRQVLDGRLADMSLVSKQHALSGSLDYEASQQHETSLDKLEGCRFLVSFPSQPGVIGVWPLLYDTLPNAKRIGVIKVGMKKSWSEEDNPRCKLSLQASNCPLWHFSGKVSDICWADISDNIYYALFCSSGGLGDSSNAMMVPLFDFCPTEEDQDYLNCFRCDFDLGQGAVWSCAWNQPTQSAAFGLEGQAMVTDIFTTECEHIFTKKQNPLSVCFAVDGLQMFSGTNKSEILCTDFRERPKERCAYSFPTRSPVSHMQFLDNPNILLLSGYSNLLHSVDLRMRKPLTTYTGHVNQHLKLPFSLDNQDDILCSVGQDGCTRLWHLSNGNLVSSIPAPYPVTPRNIPAVCYKSNWIKDTTGCPAVLMAVKDEILVFQP